MSEKVRGRIALISLYDTGAMGLRTISSVLKNDDHEVHLIFFKQMTNIDIGEQLRTEPAATVAEKYTNGDIRELIDLLLNIDPDIIGISLRSSFYGLFTEISKEIREKSHALLVVGGIHPTISPDECINHADVVCIGEGEEAFSELAQKVYFKEDIKRIKNLWIKRDGEITKNELRPLIDLNKLPFIDYSIDNKYYIDAKPFDMSIYDIMTSRGCPFSCTYCCNSTLRSVFKGRGIYVRRRSVDNVIEELKYAKRTFEEITHIRFQDDVFTFDKTWLKEFKLKYKQDINIPFVCYIHSSMIDKEIIQDLTECGLSGVAMGIQSGSEKIRKNIFNRKVTNQEILNAARLLNNKVSVTYDIIADNPFEDENDIYETLNLLLSIPRPFTLVAHSLNFFPKAEITERALKQGFIKESNIEGNNQKALSQWLFTRNYDRPERLNILYSLIILTQSDFIPIELIKSLENKIDFLTRNPDVLNNLFKSINHIKLNAKNAISGVPVQGIIPYYMPKYFNIEDKIEYKILLYSNEIEYNNHIFSLDIYPVTEPHHPNRHLGFWNKKINKLSGSVNINIRFHFPRVIFFIDGLENTPDDQWIGSLSGNGVYAINFFLWEKGNNKPIIHDMKFQLIFSDGILTDKIKESKKVNGIMKLIDGMKSIIKTKVLFE